MIKKDFFPSRPNATPTIYAYQLDGVDSHKGLLKVGFTDRDAATRVAEQLKTARLKYKIVWESSAMRNDGSSFTDFDIHRYLKKKKIKNVDGEWYQCTIKDLDAALIAVRDKIENEENRTENFAMRPEQEKAVEKTITYFDSFKKENPGKTPHFLWNAKMRFGKTFAS